MQSRTHSMIEVLLNIGTGFIISALLQQFVVAKIWNLQTSAIDNLAITIFLPSSQSLGAMCSAGWPTR